MRKASLRICSSCNLPLIDYPAKTVMVAVPRALVRILNPRPTVPRWLAAGDFDRDGDGLLGLVTPLFRQGEHGLRVFHGAGDGAFPVQEDVFLDSEAGMATFGDVDKDALPDLAAVFRRRIVVLYALGSGGEPRKETSTFPKTSASSRSATSTATAAPTWPPRTD
jgi:hypothetical protein